MRYEAGQSTEDIDVTHRRVLNYLLMKRGITPKDWDEGIRETLVGAWHTQDGTCAFVSALLNTSGIDLAVDFLMFDTLLGTDTCPAWPDTLAALERLKEKFIMSVH